MLAWTVEEIQQLRPLLDRVPADLEPLERGHILVVCSACGELALTIADLVPLVAVVGLERDARQLQLAREAASLVAHHNVRFRQLDSGSIPFPDRVFDSVVSEFVVFPTDKPRLITHQEMARVLRKGGMLVLTEAVATAPIPAKERGLLRKLGVGQLHEGTIGGLRGSIEDAGLVNLEIEDFTPSVRQVWEMRSKLDDGRLSKGYGILLDHGPYSLGRGIQYLYIRGKRR